MGDIGRAPTDFRALRQRMVEEQLEARGIADERVLEAMARVPREAFVPESLREMAYDDGALPIGSGQTISQPWIVAAICQALDLGGDEVVLEIGTGSGYSTAVLAALSDEVVSIERERTLSEAAGVVLRDLGIDNVELVVGDGSVGWPERSPYGGIAVHAGAPEIPAPLLDELGGEAWLVVPVSADGSEVLTRARRDRSGGIDSEQLGSCRFVPLIGEAGYSER